MNYKLKIDLSRFADVVIKEDYDANGDLAKGIFIPFGKNRIYNGRKGTHVYARGIKMKPNPHGTSHVVVALIGGEMARKAQGTIYQSMIVGDMIPEEQGFHFDPNAIKKKDIDDILNE